MNGIIWLPIGVSLGVALMNLQRERTRRTLRELVDGGQLVAHAADGTRLSSEMLLSALDRALMKGTTPDQLARQRWQALAVFAIVMVATAALVVITLR